MSTPLVYLGEVTTEEDGKRMLAFQDTVSYVLFGSRLDLPDDQVNEEQDEISLEL